MSGIIEFFETQSHVLFSGIGTFVVASIPAIWSFISSRSSLRHELDAKNYASEAEKFAEKLKSSARIAKGHALLPHLENALKELQGRKKLTVSKFSKICDYTSNFLANYQKENEVYNLVRDIQNNGHLAENYLGDANPDLEELEELRHGIRADLQEAITTLKNEDA